MIDWPASRIPTSIRASYRSRGLTGPADLATVLSATARRWPDDLALLDLASGGTPHRYRDLSQRADHLLRWWQRSGLRPGDVVMAQAPNSAELVVALWAAFRGGLVLAPVVDMYRRHELAQLVSQVRPVAVVSTAEDGPDLAREIDEVMGAADLPCRSRLLLRGEHRGWTSLDEATAQPDADPEPVTVDAARPALILFTSGTSAAPKAVVHSSESLLAEVHQQRWSKGLGWRDRGYVAVPLAHLAGLLNAVLIPGAIGSTVVLSRPRSLDLTAQEVLEHQVTEASGPTTLLDAIATAADGRRDVALRRWWTGGMTVAGDSLRRAEDLGIAPFRTYGMTELPTVTQSCDRDPAHQRLDTDGRIAPGVEVRVVDGEGRTLPPGREGELHVRGPEQMLGYLGPDDGSVDDEGWFATGDVGVVDQGCVTVSGRIKEIINRGGEKFSARDIEDVVHRHPAIGRVAVVAAPHERLGEVPAAFVSVRPDRSRPSDETLNAFLVDEGVARQKLPTRWVWVERWPETSLGKIRKRDLLEHLDEL